MKLYNKKGFFALTKLTSFLILGLFVFIAGGCGDDDENGPEAPVITSLNPDSGLVGSVVTITGSNFGTSSTETTVNFGTASANINTISPTLINVDVPNGLSTGTIIVTVTLDGRTSNQVEFEVTELPVPSIDNIDPTTGLPGTPITITGTNFSDVEGENTVSIADENVAVTSASTTEIVATVPDSLGAGEISISVTVDGRTSNLVSFTVLAPEISSISPGNGPIGTVVEINGNNFSTDMEDNTVTFGDVVADITSVTATQIITEVPLGVPASALQVRVIVNGSASNGLQFNVEGPAANTVDPTTGPPGTTVTISGTNFSPNSTDNEVRFGNEVADIMAATTTSLTVEVPPTVAVETVPISITVLGQEAAGSLTFTVFIPVPPLHWVQETAGGENQLVKREVDDQGNVQITTIRSTTNTIDAIAVDPETETVYWAETEVTFIPSFQIIGNIYDAPGNVIYTGNPITSMDIDTENNQIYWTENTAVFFRADLNGNNVDPLFEGQTFEALRALTLDVDNGNIYFVDDADDQNNNLTSTVYRGDLNGTMATPIYRETDRPAGSSITGFIDLAVNGNSIYMAGSQAAGQTSQILTGNTDGNATLSMVYQSNPGNNDPMPRILGLTIDREFDYLYWINFGDAPPDRDNNGTIFRGPSNGSLDPEEIEGPLNLPNLTTNPIKNGRSRNKPNRLNIGFSF